MWRPLPKTFGHHISKSFRSRPSTKRRIFTSSSQTSYESDTPKVNFWGPTIWSLAAIISLYGVAAAWEVHSDMNDVKARRNFFRQESWTFEQLERQKNAERAMKVRAGEQLGLHTLDPSQFSKTFQRLSDPDQTLVALAGTNVGIFGFSAALPAFARQLYHIPAAGVHRNYTMFTSMFGHAGLLHLGVNMYALLNFGRPVARSRVFEGSGKHLTAFYLSAGVFASWFSHITSIWPAQRVRLSAGLGASGAICALVSAFGMSFPDARLGIILIPIFIPASQALIGFAALETYGLFRGIPFYPVGHGAHLGGLIAGAAYVYFDGKAHIWTPMKKFAYNSMRGVGLLGASAK